MYRVGFFPAFFNLGETQRLVQIARHFVKLGGEVVFFSHGGIYEWLAREEGFEIINIEPIYTWRDIERLLELERSENIFKILLTEPYPEKWFVQHVINEINAFRDAGVDCVVVASNPPSSISARALGIPLISVVPGTFIPPFFEQGLAEWPKLFENWFTRLIPREIKNKMFRWFVLHSKYGIKTFNKVAKRFGVKMFKRAFDLYLGDVTLVTDYPEYLGIVPTRDFPRENFIGPFPPPKTRFNEINIKIQRIVLDHLRRERSILISMGSSGTKSIILRIVRALIPKNYNIVVVSTVLNSVNDFNYKENVLFTKWVPDIEQAFKEAKLLIIHGGENTVHLAAYSGRPIIGIAMQVEQEYNLAVLMRHKVGIAFTKKSFNEEKIVKSVDHIFRNYSSYIENARKLANRLPPPKGDINGAIRMYEILRKYH